MSRYPTFYRRRPRLGTPSKDSGPEQNAIQLSKNKSPGYGEKPPRSGLVQLWIKVCQLESELWHKYDEDFMNLMMNKEDDNLTDDPLDPKDDVFPF